MTASPSTRTVRTTVVTIPATAQTLKRQGHCLHMIGGNVALRLCTIGYDCARCHYDQMLEDSGMLTVAIHSGGIGPLSLAA